MGKMIKKLSQIQNLKKKNDCWSKLANYNCTSGCFLWWKNRGLSFLCRGRKKYSYQVLSLCPFINKTEKISIGHPHIITENFFLLTTCNVLAPNGLFIPVLLTRVNSKLLFGLCKSYKKYVNMHTFRGRAILHWHVGLR